MPAKQPLQQKQPASRSAKMPQSIAPSHAPGRGASNRSLTSLFRLARSAAPLPACSLTISSPTEPAERQADRVADAVMHMPVVQGQCAASEEDDQKLHRAVSSPLTISSPTDPEELEAERIACEVMRMPAPSATLQRKCATCEEEDPLHRDAASPGPNNPSATQSVRHTLSQSGQPLAPATRAFFEPRFATDLSHVRIHDNAQAAHSADAVNAKAYTVGHNIAFATGRYAPESVSGKKLLAHELTHVLQQSTTSILSVFRQHEAGDTTNQLFPGSNFTPYQRSLLIEASRQLNNPPAPHIIGVLITENNGNIPLVSGGGQGFSSHIEGKATKIMLDLGITRAMLIVQLEPCLTCDRSTYGSNGPETPLISPRTGRVMSRQTPRISSVLPIGTRLIVVGPESTASYDGIRSNVPTSLNQGISHPNTPSAFQPAPPNPLNQLQAVTSPALVASQNRLNRLRAAEYILMKYERFLTEPARQSSTVRSARFALEFELAMYSSLPVLSDATSLQIRQSALQRLNTPFEIENLLTPEKMNTLLELARIGPYREIYEEELIHARRTGRMSDRGIDALWEFDPEAARQLIGRSGMSRVEQRRVLSRIPGQPMRAGTRVMGGALLALTIFQEVAPLIQQQQARNYDEDVRTGLNDILWWQAKGVLPRMRAINIEWFGTSEITENPEQVEKLLSEREIDFLALLGIDDAGWDNFTVWATTHLQTFLDWDSFIVQAPGIRGQGPSVSEKQWEYRTTTIEEGRFGYRIVEDWKPSPRLTNILNVAARQMVENTQQQIDQITSGPGAYNGPAFTSPDTYSSQVIFTGKPRAIAKKMFKPGADRELYTIANQRSREGFSADALFHVFPNSASPNPVPSGYIVVGGADYNTYISIYYTRNYARQGEIEDRILEPNTLELLLARTISLIDAQ